MSSIVPGFEYDIFISYRQKDNKGDRWVTEFVNALKTELESTFKEDISIYFDSNPHDGLLETHDVDDSLRDKLKCLIFIPILSQTYCDPKSFAWKNEFLAFKKVASEDTIGLKVKLASGNVASRMLPVCIHELDAADKQLVETELGGPIRGIEFIYKSQGVVRPLRPVETDVKANLNHTVYHDQINKVSRAIKELMVAMKSPGAASVNHKSVASSESVSPSARKKLSLAAAAIIALGMIGYSYFYFTGAGTKLFREHEKSIAVLPFENMNRDSTQDYFSSGIAEDILNHLVKISELEVKSRTSTLQYKGTTKTAPVIGDELGVSNIVEGSVRRVGDKVRIVVQLIDTESDTHLWSETYDRDFKDVLSLQSEIAIEIARALQATLTLSEQNDIKKEVTQNATAYDYYLKAREFRRRGNITRNETESAMLLVDQALAIDSKFSRAYALKATLWWDISTFGVSQSIWYDSAMRNADYAIQLDETSPDGHLIKARINHYMGKLTDSNAEFEQAYKLAPNNPEAAYAYGYLLLRKQKEEGAQLVLKATVDQFSLKDPEYYNALMNAYFNAGDYNTAEELLIRAKSLNPGAVEPYQNLAYLYMESGRFDKALETMEVANKISPNLPFNYDVLAWTYFKKKDYPNAIKYWSTYPQLEAQFSDTTQTIPFRHRLAMTYAKVGKMKEGERLVIEDMEIRKGLLQKNRGMGTWANFGSVYYDLAADHAFLGNDALAVQCLDSAFQYQFYYRSGYANDPMFEGIKDRNDFKNVAKKVDDHYAFMQKAFSNALNRAQASKELKGLMDK